MILNAPKEFPLHKPDVDHDTKRSDLCIVFCKNGEVDLAVYDDNKGQWYSMTDPTGFTCVDWFSYFPYPEKFEFSKEFEDLLDGKGDYEIQSGT